jgi:hypothetical protein
MSHTPALDVAIDLLNDLLDPDGSGHAIPQDLRTRAYVARAMLERSRRRDLALRQDEVEKCLGN